MTKFFYLSFKRFESMGAQWDTVKTINSMLCKELFDCRAFLCQNALLKTVEIEKNFKIFQS